MTTSTTSPAAPPKPDPVFRLGLVGHRDLRGLLPPPAANAAPGSKADFRPVTATIDRALREVFAALEIEVKDAVADPITHPYYSDAAPVIRTINGLADGVDQIGSAVIVDLKNRRPAPAVCFELHGVFPAKSSSYPGEQIFNHDEFDRLVAETAHIVRLDGDFSPPNGNLRNVQDDADSHPYRAQSWFTREHSDLLLAVLDPSHAGGSGGTAETVRLALGEGLPVLCIHLQRAANPPLAGGLGQPNSSPVVGTRISLCLSLAEFNAGTGAAAGAWREALRQRVQAVLCLPTSPGSPDADEYQRRCLDKFFDPPMRDGFLWTTVYRWPWRLLVGLLGGKTVRAPTAGGSSDESIADSKNRSAEDEWAYTPWLEAADRLSMRYLTFYRSAFVLSYLLAIVALTAATAKLTFPHGHESEQAVALVPTHEQTQPRQMDGPTKPPDSPAQPGPALPGTHHSAEAAHAPGHPSTPPHTSAPLQMPGWMAEFLAWTKVVVLLGLIVNVWFSERGRWHRRGMDFRLLAESFRTMNYLETVGASAPHSRLPPQYLEAEDIGAKIDWEHPRLGWVDWLFRAVLRTRPIAATLRRETMPKELSLDGGSLASAIGRIQDDWLVGQMTYHSNNHHRMHRFHHLLHRLEQGLFTGTLVFAVLLLFKWDGVWRQIAQALTIIAPGAAGCILGLLYQSEARRLAERSRAMRLRLEAHAQEIEALRAVALGGGPMAASLAQSTKKIAQTMIDEVADWRVVYRPHAVGLR